MSKWDKDYLDLCRRILSDGVEVENRTGINTIKVPSHHFHFDLSEEFPILTTKQLFIRQAVLEMLWIYQAQSNDVRWLQERDVKIWNEWEIDENGIWTADQMLPDENGELKKVTIHKNFGKEYAHTIGTAYGYIVNKFKMTQNLINTIKTNPKDRRMVMTLWQNDYLDTGLFTSQSDKTEEQTLVSWLVTAMDKSDFFLNMTQNIIPESFLTIIFSRCKKTET